jgi:hypothetical protein
MAAARRFLRIGSHMDPAVIALFRELADRSPLERERYYARQRVPAAIRAEVESLLRFDGETIDAIQSRVAALAAQVVVDGREALHAAALPEDGRQAVENASPGAPGPALANGTVFGPYRIVRPLGRGGMGVVYEADEIESGRRVALKVLEEHINDERERERFDREGRLAASINHPHCVFVFAASELDGRMAIAMELMGGTLADRLKAHGPLPVASAVDAALQLVAGLQATSALGILHRDVKPSNCFVDADGVVKIGDFGISRSLRPTEETAFSTRTKFAATPAYASPEQLRGTALDIRADIYSLGATLYELLTGHRPFTGTDLMSVLMAVANDPPQPPHALVPGIPKGLSEVILRCLAKQPDRRFDDYEAFAAALEPYSSRAASPATFGRRCLAGVVDHVLLWILNLALTFWATGFMLTIERDLVWRQLIAAYLLFLLYFGVTESVWASTPGKALLGLTLVDTDGRPPRVAQTLTRAALYATAWNIGGVLWLALWGTDLKALALNPNRGVILLASLLPWMIVAALFSTVRRRNGYASLHDLATGTRVVERSVQTRAERSAPSPSPMTATHEAVGRLGSFLIVDGALSGMPAGWRPGFDERLRRGVWIRQVPPGTPPIDQGRIAINRPTRLRWLAGRREPHEGWDVFEAVPGVPLEQACARPPAWADARWWLLDLARECAAQGPDGRPPLRADRVWVLESGGAKLIDDPSMDYAEGDTSHRRFSCAPLLIDVVHAARGSSAPPWPLGAHRFVQRLGAEAPLGDAAIVNALESLTRQRAVLTRRWRALWMMAVAVVPVVFSGSTVLMTGYMAAQIQRIPPDVLVAVEGLGQLRRAERGRIALSSQDREVIEVALATRYRHVLTDRRLFGPEYLYVGLSLQERIERVLRRKPTEAESRRATEHPVVQAIVKEASKNMDPPRLPVLAILVLVACFLVEALFALAAGVAFRGGLLRILGLELVTANGQPASRLRVLVRTAFAWAPVLVLAPVSMTKAAVLVTTSGPIELIVAMGAALLAILAGAIVTLVHPARGIQDWLAGTWVVPR